MSRSSIAIGDSWVLCKAQSLPQIQRHECGWIIWVGHSRKMCNQSQFIQGNLHGQQLESLVSLRAAMSILYLESSQEMSAVRRRAPSPVSCRVRTFQLATTSGLCFIEEVTLYFFRTHVG